jgi:hypothetical protein
MPGPQPEFIWSRDSSFRVATPFRMFGFRGRPHAPSPAPAGSEEPPAVSVPRRFRRRAGAPAVLAPPSGWFRLLVSMRIPLKNRLGVIGVRRRFIVTYIVTLPTRQKQRPVTHCSYGP